MINYEAAKHLYSINSEVMAVRLVNINFYTIKILCYTFSNSTKIPITVYVY